MTQDTHQAALEAFSDVKDAWRENHARMLEDLEFSNPADPQQWAQEAITARQGRVRLTLDRTNQYIVQIVNEGRKNKPSVKTMPADSRGDVDVATQLDGMFRHIEYRSRASIAYDTALDGAVRCGVGWIRVTPRVVDVETNQQEICIDRVLDPLGCIINGTEPDGADSTEGWAETLMPLKQFEVKWPNARKASWEGQSYWSAPEGYIRIAERQYVTEKKSQRFIVEDPQLGDLNLSEEDYWKLAQQIGYQPPVRVEEAKTRVVKWCKLSAAEVLEESIYPGEYIGIVPVIGFELQVRGKRFICGATRRLMDGQRAYNYERSAYVESVALQPKAPIMVAEESLGTGVNAHWEGLNRGQPAFLPWKALDINGNALPKPDRLSPPTIPTAFAQGAQVAVADMEAAIGMNQAILGAQNNATSGRQERERREQGATATYHFIDNLSRSVEQVGRIVIGQIPIIYDQKRMAKILGLDGAHGEVMVDPTMPNAVAKKGKKVIAINPGVGKYDVRATAGPSYVTQREEAGEGITAALQAAPDFAPILMPALMKMKDWPEAEKISKAMLTMAPPAVQDVMKEGSGEEEQEPIPPQVQQAMQQMQEQMQQMSQMLDAAEKHIAELESKQQMEAAKLMAKSEADEANEQTAQYKAETERMTVVAPALDANQLAAVIRQTLMDVLNAPPPEASEPPSLEPEQPEPAEQEPQ